VWRSSAWHAVVLAGFLAVAAGCGPSRVSVPQQFPVPLVERLPVAVGVRLDESLLGYSHTEELESGKEWHIELGSAQTAMFRNLLDGMFVRSGVVEGGGAGDFDAVLVPSIQEIQFSTPDQTKSDYFEVWIRYQMRLEGPDGALIAEWPLTAYGQSNEQNFGLQGQEPALQAAALAACRDAMAFFVVQFRSVPAIEAWLAGKTGAPAGGPAA
jgi:hypothetical protein